MNVLKLITQIGWKLKIKTPFVSQYKKIYNNINKTVFKWNAITSGIIGCTINTNIC